MEKQDVIDLFNWLGVDKWLQDKKALEAFAQQIISKKKTDYQKLYRELKQLQDFINTLKKEHNLSQRDIQSWWQLYSKDTGQALSKSILGRHSSRAPKSSLLDISDSAADTSMAYVYLTFNILAVAIASLAAFAPATGAVSAVTGLTASTVTGATWNYIDVIGGFVQAAKAFHDKDYGTGSATLLSSAQLLSCTLSANIGYYVTHSVSASLAGALMGFSFAACMMIAAGIEYAKAYGYKKKMNKLKVKLDRTKEKVQSLKSKLDTAEPDTEKQKQLEVEYNQLIKEYAQQQSSYYLLEAKYADHQRAAIAWTCCAVAMTAVAIVALVAASGASFGAVPVAIAVVAAISGLVRVYWKDAVKHEENLNQSFIQSSDNKSLKQRVDDLVSKNIITIDGKTYHLNTEVKINSGSHFSAMKTNFADYLYQMLHQSPEKADAIIELLENKSVNSSDLKKLLAKRRGLSARFGPTTGVKLLSKLLTQPQETESDNIIVQNPGSLEP